MTKVVIFGNSGSGKSTLAKKIASKYKAMHLDLDTVAWKNATIPERLPVQESYEKIEKLLQGTKCWVIEGCYADLVSVCQEDADELVFLDISIEQCIENAKARPYEPHKYKSKEEQDANLDMLIDWINQYEIRMDCFSKMAHTKIYNNFKGNKRRINEYVQANEIYQTET